MQQMLATNVGNSRDRTEHRGSQELAGNAPFGPTPVCRSDLILSLPFIQPGQFSVLTKEIITTEYCPVNI